MDLNQILFQALVTRELVVHVLRGLSLTLPQYAVVPVRPTALAMAGPLITEMAITVTSNLRLVQIRRLKIYTQFLD